MIVKVDLKDENNPMEHTSIKDVERMEYRYNKSIEEYMVYIGTDGDFITIPIDAIENLEIKEG